MKLLPSALKLPLKAGGAKLFSLQSSDGAWGGVAWNRGWNSTMHVLMLLREFGLDPKSHQALRALELVRDHVTWQGCGPQECDNNKFFEGEIEPCINAQVSMVGAYFQQDVQAIIHRLLAEQLPDGGWNCEAPHNSTRSSFNTTICVLEALLEYERLLSENSELYKARLRGEAYLLERQLYKRKSTGEAIKDRKGNTSWSQFAFPTWWHYDILRALEYLRKAEFKPDERIARSIELVMSKRQDDGRWLLEVSYPGEMPLNLAENVGEPSRWITLRALRVLNWFAS